MKEFDDMNEKKDVIYHKLLDQFRKTQEREPNQVERNVIYGKVDREAEKINRFYNKRLRENNRDLTDEQKIKIWNRTVDDRINQKQSIAQRIKYGIIGFAMGVVATLGGTKLLNQPKTEPVQNPNPITTEMPTEELTTELTTETDTKGNDFRDGLKVEPETEEETKEDNGKEIIEEFIKDYNEKNNEDIEVNDLRYFISSGQGYGLYQKDDGSYLYSVTKERVQAKFLGGESGDKVYMLIDEDNKIVASIGKISGKYTAIDVQDAVKDPQNVYISNGHQYDMSQLIDEKTTGEDIVNAITSIDNYKDSSRFIDEDHGHDDEDR